MKKIVLKASRGTTFLFTNLRARTMSIRLSPPYQMKNNDAGEAAMSFEQHGEPYTDVVSSHAPALGSAWLSLVLSPVPFATSTGLPCLGSLRSHWGERALLKLPAPAALPPSPSPVSRYLPW